MTVNPITPLSSRPPGEMEAATAGSTRRALRRLRMEQTSVAGQLSRKDWNALIVAALANPPADSQAAPVVQDTPAETEGYTLAASQTTATAAAATALATANAAALGAAAVVRDAAATPVQAAQAITIAADAVTAAMAAVNAAAQTGQAPAVQDLSGLGADATAMFMGAGFLGPPAGLVSGAPGRSSEGEAIPSVDGVPPAPALASNTYSNPHERSFGQAGPAHTSPMVPATEPTADPELDLKA